MWTTPLSLWAPLSIFALPGIPVHSLAPESAAGWHHCSAGCAVLSQSYSSDARWVPRGPQAPAKGEGGGDALPLASPAPCGEAQTAPHQSRSKRKTH